MDNPELAMAIIAIGVSIFLAVGWWAKNQEAKGWNDGWCRECGTEWECFDMDSRGGRGYLCQCKKRHSFWASYNVDDKL